MKQILSMLDNLYLQNTLSEWLWALGVMLLVLTVALVTRQIARRNYTRMAATEEVELMEVPLQIVSRTHGLFLLILSVFLGLQTLTKTLRVETLSEKAMLIAACWQVGIWATTGALAWINLKQRAKMVDDRATAGTLGIIAIIVRMLIWSIVLLLTLDNLGINVTTLVAGLGVGGIAIALAVQNVLGDLLASLSITLDKPFVLGDFLIVDDFMGAVEYIGIKSVRLRSLGGEQIIMPNADLLKSRVRNYGRMLERRVLFSVGVTYETPHDKLSRVPQIVGDIVKAQDKLRFDRCHLARLNDFSIDCEVVYYVLSADYSQYMDIQQNIILQIYQAFEREGIEFAYPTQKLWMTNVPTSNAASTESSGS